MMRSCTRAALRRLPHAIVAFMHGQNTVETLASDDVKLFLALCRKPTLGAAALALRVDASTVSRRLATLEATLTTSLFDRGRDGVTPIEAAEALLPIAEEIEAGM